MLKEILDQVGRHFQIKAVKTSSFEFKLLTRVTVNILVVAVLLISLPQFFG